MDLARNNNKDWMDANRSMYLNNVKAAFEGFIEALINKMKGQYGLGDLRASDCIFRINRDIRFSKDKTPYKMQMSALIIKGGKKQLSGSGLYIEIGPEFLSIYTGYYWPDKVQLDAIRHKIASNVSGFNTIIQAKQFKANFEAPQGEKSKILPADLKKAAADCPYIYNKQFYVMHRIDAEKILEPGLMEYVLKVFASADAFNAFLA